MPQDSSAWHSCSTNQADGKASLPPPTATARSRHVLSATSCAMPSGLLFPEAQATAETHTPQAWRGLLTARPPQGQRGEASTAQPQQGWTLPRDGQRGGQGAGRGLGPQAVPLPSPSPALSQGFEAPTSHQSPGEETHSPAPCGGTPIPAHWGLPLPSPSPCHARGRWPHRGSGPCSVGVKSLRATHGALHRPALAPGAIPATLRHPVLPRAAATPGQDRRPLGARLTRLRPKASGSSRGTP